jgi:hypothetical protein
MAPGECLHDPSRTYGTAATEEADNCCADLYMERASNVLAGGQAAPGSQIAQGGARRPSLLHPSRVDQDQPDYEDDPATRVSLISRSVVPSVEPELLNVCLQVMSGERSRTMRIFVGSSSEAERLATGIKAVLEEYRDTKDIALHIGGSSRTLVSHSLPHS